MKKEQLKERVGELDLVDTVFEVDGASYIDTVVSLMQVYDLIDQLDEPEKIIIPQSVADWWERDDDFVTLYGGLRAEKKHKFDLVSIFYDKGLGDYLLKVEDWIYENDSVFFDLVNGKSYEVEKEKLYFISFPNPDLGRINMWRNTDTGSYYFAKSSSDTSQDGYKCVFTEKEIKEYDARYWPFAVEVEE